MQCPPINRSGLVCTPMQCPPINRSGLVCTPMQCPPINRSGLVCTPMQCPPINRSGLVCTQYGVHTRPICTCIQALELKKQHKQTMLPNSGELNVKVRILTSGLKKQNFLCHLEILYTVVALQFANKKRYSPDRCLCKAQRCQQRRYFKLLRAQESIPPASVTWRACTTTLFLVGSQPPQIVLKFQHRTYIFFLDHIVPRQKYYPEREKARKIYMRCCSIGLQVKVL